MGSFAVGQVVLVAFPYADFSEFKKRPALIIGLAEFNNLILCQITSQKATSQRAIPVNNNNFSEGSLNVDSFIRPDKIFTVEESVILTTLGTLNQETVSQVKASIRDIFR